MSRTFDEKAEATYKLLNFPFWKNVISRGFERVHTYQGLEVVQVLIFLMLRYADDYSLCI